MDDRSAAISYLADGFALLRKHGLYGNSDEPHRFAIDRTLTNLKVRQGDGSSVLPSQRQKALIRQKNRPPVLPNRPPVLPNRPPALHCIDGAVEAAAALQALYEAKRLVTARSSIEGRRIILGDWFMSLAVGLALPLRNARLTGLMSEELCRIGTDANHISRYVSRQDYCETIDRFTEALIDNEYGSVRQGDGSSVLSAPFGAGLIRQKNRPPVGLIRQKNRPPVLRSLFIPDNKLLKAIGSGYHKTALVQTRNALSHMEAWFTDRYASETAGETDGWIYGAIMSGGKRMRPILVCLCAGLGAEEAAADHDFDESILIDIMSTIELMHSASLVHDDIVDRSPMRRSRATINAEKGDGYAAMCGFIMIADSLRLISSSPSDILVKKLSSIPAQMCNGELHQLDVENKPEFQSEDEYFDRISCKTAALIEGSCISGAIAGGAAEHTVQVLSDFGRALGLLFQLRDDLIDYGMPDSSGKPVSQDMERGVYSLPLLYAREVLSNSDQEEYKKLDTVLRKHIKEPSDFRYLNMIAENTGGISYTLEKIENQATSALSSLMLLPQNTWTEALSLIVITLAENYTRETFFTNSNVRLSNE